MSSAQNATETAHVGWISPVPRRSTWDIIWTCLSVFLICSWKCTHLNLPTREESRAGWLKWWWVLPVWPTRPLWRKWRRKLMWMLLIALCTELVVALAMDQNLKARRDLKKARKLTEGRPAARHYSLAHAFYARMGGFIVIQGLYHEERGRSSPVPENPRGLDGEDIQAIEKGGGNNSHVPTNSSTRRCRFLTLENLGMSWPCFWALAIHVAIDVRVGSNTLYFKPKQSSKETASSFP